MGNSVEPEYDAGLFNQLLTGLTHEISNCSQSILLISQLWQEFWVDVKGVLASHMHKHGDFLAGGISFSRLQLDMPDYLASVVDNAGRIDIMVLELNSLFRAPDHTPRAANLNAVARSVQILTAHMLKQAGLLLSLQTEEGLPPVTARARDLVFGLATLIQRLCQNGDGRPLSLTLRTQLSAQDQTVSCQLLLPSEAGLAEQLVGEKNSQRLFARNGGNLEVQRAGEILQLTLSFPLPTERARDDGH